MKITRYYASTTTAVNVKDIIQDLLIIELERLIHCSPKKEDTDLPVSIESSGRD